MSDKGTKYAKLCNIITLKKRGGTTYAYTIYHYCYTTNNITGSKIIKGAAGTHLILAAGIRAILISQTVQEKS